MRGGPNLAINAAGEAFGVNIFYLVAEGSKRRDKIRRKVFVELDAHSDRGNAGHRQILFRRRGGEGDYGLDVAAG